MPSQSNDIKQIGIFTAISLLVHVLLILLLPGFGNAPLPVPLGKGGVGVVSIVQATAPAPKSTTAGGGNNPARSPQVARVSTTSVVTKPKPSAASATPASAKPATPARPVVSSKPVVGSQPAPSKSQTGRVLTSTKGIDGSVAEAKESRPTQPVEPAKPQVPAVDKVTGPTVDASEAPPGPPVGGELVGGFGLRPKYPAKEAANLSNGIKLKVTVVVPPKGTPSGRLAASSGSDDLDRWILLWVVRRLEFKPWNDSYQVTVDVTIDPDAQNVTFQLAAPNERVRIVQP